MHLILNIGLDPQATPELAAHVTREILVANGFLLGKSRVVQSDTEPTLAIEVTGPEGWVTARINRTAVDLNQECIAVWNPARQAGVLLGPKPWGPFDPKLFFTVHNTRLSEHL